MPASAMAPTMENQVRKARQAARKSAGRLRELVADSTHAGTTPATHTAAAMNTAGCIAGKDVDSHPSAGTPKRIHQMPAEWARNRITDMGGSINDAAM